MRRTGHPALVFLLVLLAGLVGATLARRLVGPVQGPNLDALAAVPTVLAEADISSLIPRLNLPGSEQARRAVAPPVAAETAVVASAQTPAAAATPAVTAATVEVHAASTDTPTPPRPTPTPAPPTPTPTAAPTLQTGPAYQFLPAGPVRHTVGDCPGPSIRGTVRDAAGNPLAGVRLWRYDQWGNEHTVESKSGEVDRGQYDFPLGDTPNVHYVQVVDSSGAPISPSVEVQHRQGDAPDATCHWLDWVRQ